MAQLFGYAGNIRAVGDGYGGKTMSELVRVEVCNALALAEPLEIACRALRVHDFRTPLL